MATLSDEAARAQVLLWLVHSNAYLGLGRWPVEPQNAASRWVRTPGQVHALVLTIDAQ
jgi:hypothetical protein